MIAGFEKKLAIILMFAMAVIVFSAVIFRSANAPLFWAGEISIFLLIYITFIGGSLGLKYKTQAAVTLLTDLLPGSINKGVTILAHILMLAFMAILLFYCFSWISSPGVAIQKSSAILLPMWIPYSILPIGLLFASIHLVSNLLDVTKGSEVK